jgi:hypothetical protein
MNVILSEVRTEAVHPKFIAPKELESGNIREMAPSLGIGFRIPFSAANETRTSSPPSFSRDSDFEEKKTHRVCFAHWGWMEPASARNEIIVFPMKMSQGCSCGRNPRQFQITILVPQRHQLLAMNRPHAPQIEGIVWSTGHRRSPHHG